MTPKLEESTGSSPPESVQDNNTPKRSLSRKRTSTFAELEVDIKAPEPPSKRARRALKKGKPLPPKHDSDSEAKQGSDAEDNGAKANARSEHGVWIGNLPFSATASELRKWLLENSGGVITEESITRVKLPMAKPSGNDKKDTQLNKGFAYVDFDDLSPKLAAIVLSEHELGGRKVLIKDSKSFEGRPQKPKLEETAQTPSAAASKRKPQQPSRKIYVGNLGFDITEDDVYRHFEPCGEIQWVKVATFQDSGKCKGFGWVNFKSPEAAAWAVKGYVKIKEEIETEEDFAEPEPDAEPRAKKFRTKKWGVSTLYGRALKIELAEDDQSRYDKRFGKGARRNNVGINASTDSNGAEKDGEEPRMVETRPSKETLQGHKDVLQARLMGVAAKPTGKKTTFD
jgi:RNA recognition motif-containing protein